MKTYEVFRLIHQNGIGQNIECFFNTKGPNNNIFSSMVNNYKYQNGIIKIYIERSRIKLHENNLAKSSYGELLIKENEAMKSNSLRLFCKVIKIDERFIHAKALNVKYLDDDNREVKQSILSN